jgi:hypothetical protein
VTITYLRVKYGTTTALNLPCCTRDISFGIFDLFVVEVSFALCHQKETQPVSGFCNDRSDDLG